MGAMKELLLDHQALEDSIECDLAQAQLKLGKLAGICWSEGDDIPAYAPDPDILIAFYKAIDDIIQQTEQIQTAREGFKCTSLRVE